MAPLTYPSRVAWRFRNVTRGYDLWPRLESISITQSNPEDLAVFSAEVVDEDGDTTMATEDEVRVEVGGTRAFGGHINGLTRTADSEVGPRVYRLSAQDYTAKLDDSVIDHPRARRAESLADRVAWILSFLDYPVTTGGVSLPSEDSERGEYDGLTVREALDQVADEHRLAYYVDFDKDLHLFRAETIAAPFALDDTEPDYATSFPYADFAETRDSVELAKRIYVIGEKGRTWVGGGSQERSIDDPDLVTATQRQRAGERAIAENGTPQVDGSLLCHEPGLRAGMSFGLTNALWGLDAVTRIATSVEMTAVDPHDADGKAYLHTQVSFSDRRRARPHTRRRTRPEAPGTQDGDTLAVARWCYSQARNRLQLTGAFTHGPLADSQAFAGPDGPIHREVTQAAIAHNVPWTSGLCSLGLGAQTGDVVEEQWFAFDPGPLTDGEIGVRFDGTMDNVEGVAAGLTLDYGVAHAAPDDERSFEVLGTIPIAEDASWSVIVPRSTLEPSTINYLVLGASWSCLRAGCVCSEDVPGALDSVANGLYLSGAVRLEKPTATLVLVGGEGITSWVAGEGDVDGSNRTFGLIDWSGRGVPGARVGMAILAVGVDYEYDEDAGTVTLGQAPPSGSNVAFSYRI